MNPPVVTINCDPSESRARHHNKSLLKTKPRPDHWTSNFNCKMRTSSWASRSRSLSEDLYLKLYKLSNLYMGFPTKCNFICLSWMFSKDKKYHFICTWYFENIFKSAICKCLVFEMVFNSSYKRKDTVLIVLNSQVCIGLDPLTQTYSENYYRQL